MHAPDNSFAVQHVVYTQPPRCMQPPTGDTNHNVANLRTCNAHRQLSSVHTAARSRHQCMLALLDAPGTATTLFMALASGVVFGQASRLPDHMKMQRSSNTPVPGMRYSLGPVCMHTPLHLLAAQHNATAAAHLYSSAELHGLASGLPPYLGGTLVYTMPPGACHAACAQAAWLLSKQRARQTLQPSLLASVPHQGITQDSIFDAIIDRHTHVCMQCAGIFV